MHTLKETDVENLAVDIFGLLSLLKPFEHRGFFRITRTRFGALIEPNIVSNFGPMYVCRIIVQKQTPSALEAGSTAEGLVESALNQDLDENQHLDENKDLDNAHSDPENDKHLK